MRTHLKRLFTALCLCAAMGAGAQTASQPPVQAPVRIALIESLSGAFANTGEAVFRNLVWATERVNARGGVKLAGGPRNLVVERYDSKGQNEEALAALRSAIDDGVTIIAQGNSSAIAAVLVDAINKHNEREPKKRVIGLRKDENLFGHQLDRVRNRLEKSGRPDFGRSRPPLEPGGGLTLHPNQVSSIRPYETHNPKEVNDQSEWFWNEHTGFVYRSMSGITRSRLPIKAIASGYRPSSPRSPR